MIANPEIPLLKAGSVEQAASHIAAPASARGHAMLATNCGLPGLQWLNRTHRQGIRLQGRKRLPPKDCESRITTPFGQQGRHNRHETDAFQTPGEHRITIKGQIK